MPESGPYGSVRGVPSNGHPYRDQPASPVLAYKLHNVPPKLYQIRESQTHLIGASLALFQPGGCPSYRDHRNIVIEHCRCHLNAYGTER